MAVKSVAIDDQRRLAGRLLKEAAAAVDAEPSRARELARRAIILLEAAEIANEFGA